MALETGTYISDLVATNPTASDPKSQGDDNLRLLKSTIKTTFPNMTGAMTKTHTELNSVTDRGLIAGQTWTGTHDYTGGLLRVATPVGTADAVTKAYADGLSFATVLPAQAGNSGKFVTTNGTTASWAQVLPTQTSNSGKVLTTDGTNASWANLGLVLLATLTPTAAAAVNALNVFSSLYDSYVIIGEGLCPAADDALFLRMANAGVLDSGSNYARGASFSTAVVAGYGSSNADISSGQVGAAGRGLNFTAQLDNVNAASSIKTSSVRASFENITADNFQQVVLSTGYKGGVVTGIGLFWSSASVFKAQGSIRIYGIQKA